MVQQVLSLSDQLELFKEYIGKLKDMVGGEGTNSILSQSLFLLVQGSNDIAETYSVIRKGQYDFPTYADLMVGWASSFLKVIFDCHALPFPFLNTQLFNNTQSLYKTNLKGIVRIRGTKNRCFLRTAVGVPAITEKHRRRETKRVCRQYQRRIQAIQR